MISLWGRVCVYGWVGVIGQFGWVDPRPHLPTHPTHNTLPNPNTNQAPWLSLSHTQTHAYTRPQTRCPVSHIHPPTNPNKHKTHKPGAVARGAPHRHRGGGHEPALLLGERAGGGGAGDGALAPRGHLAGCVFCVCMCVCVCVCVCVNLCDCGWMDKERSRIVF